MLYVTDQRSFNVINSPIASVMSGRYLFYASEYLFLFAYYYVLFSKICSVRNPHIAMWKITARYKR